MYFVLFPSVDIVTLSLDKKGGVWELRPSEWS